MKEANREKLWIRLPVAYIGQISANALILLSLMMNMDYREGALKVKRRTLAAQMHCSDRTITNLLNELEEAGLILERRQFPSWMQLTLRGDILMPRRKTPERKPAFSPSRSSIDMNDVARLVGEIP